jgi:hypothetical protein
VSGLPAGITPVSNLPPGITPVGATPQTFYDYDSVRRLLLKHGASPDEAADLAHVSMAESSGNPQAQHTDLDKKTGKPYQTTYGLFQIADLHDKTKDFTDPDTSAQYALQLFRKNGFKDWESSRNQGGGGGWGQYVEPTANPADFAKTLNRPIVQAAGADSTFTESPIPPALPKGITPVGTRGNASPDAQAANQALLKGDRAALSQVQRTQLGNVAGQAARAAGVFGDYASQLTPVGGVAGAAIRDTIKDPLGTLDRAGFFDPTDPVGSYERLGPNSAQVGKILEHPDPQAVHQVEEEYATTSPQHGNPLGPVIAGGKKLSAAMAPAAPVMDIADPAYKAIRDFTGSEPAMRSGIDMAGQMFNVGGVVTRGAVGVLGEGARALEVPLTKASLKLEDSKALGGMVSAAMKGVHEVQEGISPLARVRRAAIQLDQDPDVAESHARAFLDAKQNAHAEAVKMTRALFSGYTPAERIEAERLRENLIPKMPDPDGRIQQLADSVRAMYVKTSNDHLSMDLFEKKLDPNTGAMSYRLKDPETYTFRGGAYTDELQDMVQHRRTGSSGGNTTGKTKYYENYDIAKASGKLKPNYDPADQTIDYLTARLTDQIKKKSLDNLRDLGIIKPLVVRDKMGNIIGQGEQGAAAAARVASGVVTDKAHETALSKLNAHRVAIGEKALTPGEFGAMRTAVAMLGRTSARYQGAVNAAKEQGRLGIAAGKAVSGTSDRVGQALLAGLNNGVAQLDKLKARITKLQEMEHTGANDSRGRQLIAAIAQRDKLAQQVENFRGAIEKQAARTLGKDQTMPVERARKLINSHDLPANRGGAPLPKREPVMAQSQIYAPVVGKLQEIAKLAEQLPRGPLRGQILRKLTAVGEKGVRAPSQLGDTADKYGRRLMVKVQGAMSAVARAGDDPTARRMLGELAKLDKSLEAQIGKQSAGIYKARDATLGPVKRIEAKVLGSNEKAQKQVDRIGARLDFALASKFDVDFYRKAFKKALGNNMTAYKNAILTKAKVGMRDRERLEPIGGAIGGDAGKSALVKYGVAPPDLVRFFVNQGADKESANSVAQFVDKMNSLARIGIITNPVIHGGWNLGTHYLAAGGTPDFLGTRLWQDFNEWPVVTSRALGRQISGQEKNQIADKWGAIIHNAQASPIFGEDYGKNFLDKASVWDFPHWMNSTLSKMWAANQRIVFEQMEARYSTDLFWKYVEKAGKADDSTFAQAAIHVRKALGDYTNISKTGIDGALNQMLFFYPWMKTAIPFWAKMIAQRPGFITVPGLGTHIWNRESGDPNFDNESYGTVYIPGGNGKRYASYPGPQKYAEDLLELIAPGGDIGASGTDRGVEAERLLDTHLKPLGASTAGASFLETMGQRPQAPGSSSSLIAVDRDQDLGTQIRQGVGFAAGRLPFEGFGVGSLIAPPEQPEGNAIGDALHGDPRRLIGGVIGGYQYDRQDEDTRSAIQQARYRLEDSLSAARKEMRDNPRQGHADTAAARAQFAQDINDILNPPKLKQRPPLPAGITPAH